MGRFAQITGGPRRRETVTLPLPGAFYDAATGKWEGPIDKLDVRALRDDEDTAVIGKAIAFAKERGSLDPKAGDELFERGRMVHTLAIACVDTESPKEKPVPYFENWEEIHKSDLLLPETIAYLYQAQRQWQDAISPLRGKLSEEEYLAGIARTIEGDTSFFLSLRPGMQWSCFASMASQLTELTRAVSQPSSQPVPSSTND